ncbi:MULTISPECIES: MBL fold metallo-hydrolase [unclassified Caballeronia]|uniref:MBL fold metallo-hydrolase n=1 Tax=unclassified Caballeronia TaxID=2646786 RepID=UPI002858B154|nr:MULTISPECIES: MBL fold metallo-hydrolase [unclassified Caballeronia]MDR5751582.1 MBL fold metallo-hydrolase [Caballeronia sp. LZ024]MDR5844278.1 MBL fold metallo-hydrolase [Caballeronia sp. LZ031]
MQPSVQPFFDLNTGTMTYVVYGTPGSACAIVDSVLDYDPKAARTSTRSADAVIAFIRETGLSVEWILETHAHADHFSAAPYLQRQLGGKIAIGESIRTVQGVFKKIFDLEPEFQLDGSQFDHLFGDGEAFRIGELQASAMYVPGHTPADMAYRIGDAVFVGDTLFMPDIGTARCDFPGGDARTLFRSIGRLLALPDETRLFVCHDYPPPTREPHWQTTVAAQRADNIHVGAGKTEDEFVAMREARDATLDMPTLILPAIQVNIRAGQFPHAAGNGTAYLKIPLNAL